MELRTRTRRWGNSIAIILPKVIVDEAEIKENDEVTINIDKSRPKAGEFFGRLKGKIKRSTQEIKDEMRKGWH